MQLVVNYVAVAPIGWRWVPPHSDGSRTYRFALYIARRRARNYGRIMLNQKPAELRTEFSGLGLSWKLSVIVYKVNCVSRVGLIL